MEHIGDVDRMVSRVRLGGELRWGAMLGALQKDGDKLRGVLRIVVDELRIDMLDLEYSLRSEGLRPASDKRYQRMFELAGVLGGLYVMMQGVDGVLTSVITDLLRGSGDESENENNEEKD